MKSLLTLLPLLLLLCTLTVKVCDAQVVPFVNCTINQGNTCLTIWGWQNQYSNQVVLSLARNRFSPAPIYRGQPTVFPGSTIVYRAFNTTRPCSSGNLTWNLVDPFTGIIYSATSTNQPGNTCVTQPVNVDCTNNALVADRLTECETLCGSQCAFCGQVYTYCNDIGLLNGNFTLENCIITNLGFDPISSGCSYEAVVSDCCQNVGPPISPPIVPPVAPPVEPPVTPPVTPPVEPPVTPPVAPPVEPPVTPPVEPPTVAPLAPPPTTPNVTFVCNFATYQQAYQCLINTSLVGLNCTQKVQLCQNQILGNTLTSESAECLLDSVALSDDDSDDCDFVDQANICCGVNPATTTLCSNQAGCSNNFVCTGPQGTCSGIQGAPCTQNANCSYAYTCQSNVCSNAAPDQLQSAVRALCTGAPILECNKTASIALREFNGLGVTLSCTNPTTSYPAAFPKAFFYLPATNASFDTYNVTFASYLPNGTSLAIRVLLPCGSPSSCNREILSEQVALTSFEYNYFFDHNAPGIQRGFALVATTTQFQPLNGIIVNVTAQCIKYEPPICQETVNQTCSGPGQCPISAPYCNTTLGVCQALIGGACRVDRQCASVQGTVCDEASCTCVGSNVGVCETSSQNAFANQVRNCILANLSGNNCSRATQLCYNVLTGQGIGGGLTREFVFEPVAECIASNRFNDTDSCGTFPCISSNCFGTRCPAVPAFNCTSSLECSNDYPFCVNGVCRGLGGVPCNEDLECESGCSLDNCTCNTSTFPCTNALTRLQYAQTIESCLAQSVGTCRDRTLNCTNSFRSLTDFNRFNNIYDCVSQANNPPSCEALTCTNQFCTSPVPVQGCANDESCSCGFCCDTFGCSECTQTCNEDADCPARRPFCSTIGRVGYCTFNSACAPPIVTPAKIPVEASLLDRMANWFRNMFV